MAIETVKLSDLSDDQIVSFPESHYTLTVAEFKKALNAKEYDAVEQEWHVVEAQTWSPCARSMLDGYIENEYQELYEDWGSRAWDCVTDDIVNKIQAILDEAFKGPDVQSYWTLEKEIEID